MSGHRVARGGLLWVAALGLLLASACQSNQEACTPESSGFGGQRQVTSRDLPGLDRKDTCQPRVKVIRSDVELRSAYAEIGVNLVDLAGHKTTPNAIPLPKVDWLKESVVLREATHLQNVSWVVVDGANVTLGTQGCLGVGDQACGVTMLAIPGILATAAAHACTDIGCGGGPSPGGE